MCHWGRSSQIYTQFIIIQYQNSTSCGWLRLDPLGCKVLDKKDKVYRDLDIGMESMIVWFEGSIGFMDWTCLIVACTPIVILSALVAFID